MGINNTIHRPLVYERVYLPLYQVADTPFHISPTHILLTSDTLTFIQDGTLSTYMFLWTGHFFKCLLFLEYATVQL